MASSDSTHGKLIPAACYVRMSGKSQEKSPAEQRAELTKLATKENCHVVKWFSDQAVSGDTNTGARPGLAALLRGAQAGEFSVVLAWHTNRVSREDPMDALVFYNQLRKAGMGLVTSCEGRIDLEDFSKQLLLFVNQKGSNDYLKELSAKVVRGKIANAKAGGWNGGQAYYGMDRGLFGPAGNFVRRLAPGETATILGHCVRLMPSTDETRLAAIRHAFQRMDTADVALRQLARELEAKGYPSPRGGGWTGDTVARLLRTKAYIGTSRWGGASWGRYHRAVGEEIVPVTGNGSRKAHPKPQEDAIEVEGTHQGIIDPDQFQRVQRKLGSQRKRHPTQRRAEYPLRDLLICGHCGKPMDGYSTVKKGRNGHGPYHYHKYLCASYVKFGRDGIRNLTCGHQTIDAKAVLNWLVRALQEVFLGPGREVLVDEIRRELKAEAKSVGVDRKRLQARATELDREVSRLVKAIRTSDIPELVEELQATRTERQTVQDALRHAGRLQDGQSLEEEAEAVVDELWALGERLTDADPAVLREVLRQFVSRIECRWEPQATKSGQTRYQFSKGTVELREQTGFSVSGVLPCASQHIPS